MRNLFSKTNNKLMNLNRPWYIYEKNNLLNSSQFMESFVQKEETNKRLFLVNEKFDYVGNRMLEVEKF